MFVFTGLASYSLYLWHWPTIVFVKYYLMRNPTAIETTAILAMSGLLAVCSWRFVEAPLRRRAGALRIEKRFIFPAAGGATVLALSVGVFVYLSAGLPQRLPEAARRLAMDAADSDVGRSPCDRKTPEEVLAGDICEIGDMSAQAPTFALLGDSFAISLRPGIESVALLAHQKGVSLTRGGCGPLVGATQYDDVNGACGEFLSAAITFVNHHPSISSLIIIARWTSAAGGTTEAQDHMYITDKYSSSPSYDENKRVFIRSLERTINVLAGHTIFVVSTIPEHFLDVPRLAALGKYLGIKINVDVSRPDVDRRQEFVRNTLDIMSHRLLFYILDLSRYLCNDKVCFGTKDGRSLYSDSDHLSHFGALAVREIFFPVFNVDSHIARMPRDEAQAADRK
jgi:hypothetical protein